MGTALDQGTGTRATGETGHAQGSGAGPGHGHAHGRGGSVGAAGAVVQGLATASSGGALLGLTAVVAQVGRGEKMK